MGKDNRILGVVDYLTHIDWTKKSTPLLAAVAILTGLGALAGVLNQFEMHIPGEYYVGTFFVLEASAVAYWLYVRWWRPFDSLTVSIGFALHPDDGSKEFHDGIMAALQRDIEQRGLRDVVKIRQLPTDLRFTSSVDAEKYLVNKGLRVLIWGDTSRGTIGGEKVTEFNVRYSCQHASRSQGERETIRSTLIEGSRRAVWSVQDTNSLPGIKLVAGNLVEVSTYVLAVSLASVGVVEHVERAATILESLMTRLEPRRQDPNFPSLNEFKRSIARLLRQVYMSLTIYYGVNKHDYAAGRKWGFKCLELAPNDYDMNIAVARYSWEQGDQSAAHTYAKAARRLRPKALVPYLNLGFFHFYNGKYPKALACYKKLDERLSSETNVIDVVDFLEREYEKTGKDALYFAAGWISHQHGDRARGREILGEFVQSTGRKKGFERLLQEAERLGIS